MFRSHLLAGTAASCLLLAAPVSAQTATPQPSSPAPIDTASAAGSGPAPGATAPQDTIIVIGSRFGGRTATQSATPVDAISREELAQSGRVDLVQQLKVQVPSFNTPRPLGAGVGDYLTAPSLRGLGPGEVLVLVNGKRRHTSADLNNSATIGRGDVSVDFNAIPAFALSRAEVLRDGASAQYGSDAISGVINLILDRSIGTRAQMTGGITTQGDGTYGEISVSSGVRVGGEGVFRLTASIQKHQLTDRSTADTRQQYFGINAAGQPVLPSANYGSGVGLTRSNGTLDPREAAFDRDVFRIGDPESTNKQIFYNFVAPAADGVEVYAFGGYSRLDGVDEYYFRRAGQDETVRAIYPDGFRPALDTRIDNFSTALGLRGDDLAGFGWDLSTVYGLNTEKLALVRSANVTLGAASPTRFHRLGADFYQWTTDLDLTREIPLGDAHPLKLAAGLEYREETYRLLSGDPLGYINGGVRILDGPNAGKIGPIGAQPGPTAGPDDRASLGRHSYAVYGDAEKTLFDRLTLQGTLRHEHYSDFGDTTNVKVAGRLGLFGGLAARASYNTGFRAPALAQEGYNASNTLILNDQQAVVRIAAVNSPAARLVGAVALKPEKSRNVSAGLTYEGGGITATLDAYQIKVRDRIAISSTFQSTALTNYLVAQGQGLYSALSFITNGVDTTNRGVDLVVSARHRFGDGSLFAGTLAGTYNKTRFDRIAGTPAPLAALGIATPLFDLTQQLRFADSLPRTKITLDLNYTRGPLALSVTNTRYGEVSTVALTSRTPAQVAALIPGYDVTLVRTSATGANSDIIQRFGAKLVTDIELSWQATQVLRLSAGAQNLLDVYPDKNIASTVASVAAGTNGADNAGTVPYNAISPFGFNGRTVFARAAVSF